MEVDTAVEVPVSTPSVNETDPKTANTEIRNNAIRIRGVDEFNTRDIESYITHFYSKPFSIEWIDDSSLNIVYDNGDDAFESLVSITAPEELERSEPIRPEEDRRVRNPVADKFAKAELFARFAFVTDRKSEHSRSKSRYYLLHGEPTRREDIVRFGTKRTTNPRMYGDRNVDIVGSLGDRHRLDDLFPTKEGAANADELPDLLEEIGKSRGSRRNRRGRGRRGKKAREDMPDLFGDKFGPRKVYEEKKTDNDLKEKKEEEAGDNSVYRNMDY